MSNHVIEYDGIHDEWLCRLLDEPGHPVVHCTSKHSLELFLDWLDARRQQMEHDRQPDGSAV